MIKSPLPVSMERYRSGHVIKTNPENLPLGELGRAACFLQAVFFPFFHPWVSSQVTVLFQYWPVAVIGMKQRPGYAVPDCAGLTGESSALYFRYHIKTALGLSSHQGLPDN